jgi:hypothetical protein
VCHSARASLLRFLDDRLHNLFDPAALLLEGLSRRRLVEAAGGVNPYSLNQSKSVKISVSWTLKKRALDSRYLAAVRFRPVLGSDASGFDQNTLLS